MPLFIKRPGQRRGETVDTRVETIDILPTLAAELGVRLPWTADGSNVLDAAWSGRPARTLLAGGASRRMAGPADLHAAVMERVAHKLALFDSGNPLHPRAAGGRGDLIGRRAADFPAAAAANIAVTVDAPELLGAVDPGGDFVPAHITGTATLPAGEPPPLLAVALNGVVAAVTRPYPFSAFGHDGAWEAIVDPGLLRPGANTLGVFAVVERAGGDVALAEAYAGSGERLAVNLIRETAAELWGVAATGFHALEHAEGRAFRWTTGEAGLSVPLDPGRAARGVGRRRVDDRPAQAAAHRGGRLRPVRRHHPEPLGRNVCARRLPADAAQPGDQPGERHARPRHQRQPHARRRRRGGRATRRRALTDAYGGDDEHANSRPQAAHSAARRQRRGAKGSPLATAGGLGRSPIQV